MTIKRSVEGLKKNAEKKRQEAFEKTEKGIQQLIKEKRPINFNTVAQASGVSKAWLYKEPEVKARIEHLREQANRKKGVPIKQRASDTSKDALIRTLRARVKRLEAENKDLRMQNEVAYGHVLKVRDLEKEIQHLRSANERLRQQSTPKSEPQATQDSIRDELSELGVGLNSTLERLINETPRGIVETAIESLKEAAQVGQLRNPGGFLNKAIADAWRPNESHQEKADMTEFNEWWKRAYGEGFAIASQQTSEGLIVLTSAGHWIPFAEAAKIFSPKEEKK